MSTSTDKALDLVEKYVTQITDLVKQYAPDVADLALRAVQMKAITTLATAFLVMLTGIGLLFLAHYLFKEAKAIMKAKDNRYMDDEEMKFMLGAAATGVVGAIATVIGFTQSVLNTATWVGVFDPLLYLAMKLVP